MARNFCRLIKRGLKDWIALAKCITGHRWLLCGESQLSSLGFNLPDDIPTSCGTMVSPETATNAEVLPHTSVQQYRRSQVCYVGADGGQK